MGFSLGFHASSDLILRRRERFLECNDLILRFFAFLKQHFAFYLRAPCLHFSASHLDDMFLRAQLLALVKCIGYTTSKKVISNNYFLRSGSRFSTSSFPSRCLSPQVCLQTTCVHAERPSWLERDLDTHRPIHAHVKLAHVP